MTSKKFLKNF